MNTRSLSRTITVAIGFMAVVCSTSTSRAEEAPLADFDFLFIEVQSDQSSYILGETVELKVKVINVLDRPICLHSRVSVLNGFVEVAIAYEEENFKEYRGPGWGFAHEGCLESIELAPNGESFETSASILYNRAFKTAHLSKLRAKWIADRYITTNYALTRPGRYFIKTILYDAEYQSTIESRPVEIVVKQPEGDDQVVWDILRGNPQCGYFIQTGGPRGRRKDPKTEAMVEMLEDLVVRYPSSRHAKGIRPALLRHYSAIERRK